MNDRLFKAFVVLWLAGTVDMGIFLFFPRRWLIRIPDHLDRPFDILVLASFVCFVVGWLGVMALVLFT